MQIPPICIYNHLHASFSTSKFHHYIMTIGRDMELSELVLARFDKLVKQGEVIWQDSTPRYVSASPFNVSTYEIP